MFIELTDHLRCVADHPESFLVLIPEAMEGRRVRSGILGCPVCQAEYRITDGVPELGTPPEFASAAARGPAGPDAAGIQAFLGLEGPGGYLALLGEAAQYTGALHSTLPGVHLVVVNPGVPVASSEAVTVVRARRMPLKVRSLRGVVVGAPLAADPIWRDDAVRAVLPGLRATGDGPAPVLQGFELLGTAAGWWVGRRTDEVRPP
jgi:uncharacterized protein YbaR (Trm112 family)